MGYDGYDGGWDDPGGLEPEYEPDADDFALMRFLDLLPGHADSDGHFPDPEIDRFGRSFDCDHGEDELFRAVLFLRGWRLARRVPWPALALLLRCLLAGLIREARQDVASPVGADRRPADDPSPPLALLRARSVLTCAPPARVPCPAGATG